MADTENKLEALEQEAVAEASANPQADAPKKNAVAAEPSHIAKMNNAEDLGPAVVKPTDSNPDATKKTKQVSGDAQQKSQGAADPMPKLSGHNTKLESTETEEGSEEIKEGEMPKAALDALKKHKEKSEDKDADKKDEKEVKEMDHMDKDKKKMDEYKIQKSADTADHSDKGAKSPVKIGGAKMGGTPVKTGSGADEKGRPAPTAEKMSDFQNTPGKDKGTAMKQQVKADTKDGSEASAKSPISGK